MKQIRNCSFSDEIVITFCYNLKLKIITLTFERYFDISKNIYNNEGCSLIIKNWEKAISRLAQNDKSDSLEENLGIIVEILDLIYEDNILKFNAVNLNETYIEYTFFNPEIQIL